VVLSGVEGRRTRLAKALIDYVEQQFAIDGTRSAKFETTISRSTVIPEAQKVGKCLFQTAPTHKVCEQFRALALEIETRLGRRPAEVPSEMVADSDQAGVPLVAGVKQLILRVRHREFVQRKRLDRDAAD
jgi:hypothetical protein